MTDLDPYGLTREARSDGFGSGIVWALLVAGGLYGLLDGFRKVLHGDLSDGWLELAAAILAFALAFKIARRSLT